MDWQAVGNDMIAAARDVTGTEWPAVREFAERELRMLAQVAARIDRRKRAGTISEENARFIMGRYQETVYAHTLALEGAARALAERVLDAALDVLRPALHESIGWDVL